MRTHSQIIREAGTAETVALNLGVSVNTVRSWIQRDSIPAERWAALRSLNAASLDELATAAATKRAA